jgi:hypothetical protein
VAKSRIASRDEEVVDYSKGRQRHESRQCHEARCSGNAGGFNRPAGIQSVPTITLEALMTA